MPDAPHPTPDPATLYARLTARGVSAAQAAWVLNNRDDPEARVALEQHATPATSCPWCDDAGCVACSLRPTENVAVGEVL